QAGAVGRGASATAGAIAAGCVVFVLARDLPIAGTAEAADGTAARAAEAAGLVRVAASVIDSEAAAAAARSEARAGPGPAPGTAVIEIARFARISGTRRHLARAAAEAGIRAHAGAAGDAGCRGDQFLRAPTVRGVVRDGHAVEDEPALVEDRAAHAGTGTADAFA